MVIIKIIYMKSPHVILTQISVWLESAAIRSNTVKREFFGLEKNFLSSTMHFG